MCLIFINIAMSRVFFLEKKHFFAIKQLLAIQNGSFDLNHFVQFIDFSQDKNFNFEQFIQKYQL